MAQDQMDDLLTSLTSSTRISLEDDDVSLIHPRYAQYKSRRPLNQEERRQKWLVEQKEKRLDSFIVSRGIEDLDCDSSDDEEMQLDSKTLRDRCPYRNCLMLSYWLVDIPENFTSDWYYLMCPVGRRAIVVASRGKTIAYSRRGQFMMKFPSALPGGNSSSKSHYTVIDCVFNYDTQNYYILDVLVWGIPLTNCTAELRFFWLTNKVAEHPELKEKSPTNRHQFVLLRHELVEGLPQAMAIHPAFDDNSPQVDGVLFYHKEALYTGGKSLLVVWLKPFMVRDILSIPVHENYLAEIPAAYASKMETEPSAAKDATTDPEPLIVDQPESS